MVDPRSMQAPSMTLLNWSINSWLPQTTPPTESEEPLINFVRLCTTTSAPNWIGEIDNGEKVLSTTSVNEYFFANAANSLISATSNKGLLTDSQYKTLVFSVIEASTISKFVISTNEVWMDNLGVKFFKNA